MTTRQSSAGAKTHFYLISTYLYDLDFVVGTWNFSEAGHGKGAADGIGGALTRTARRCVANRHDTTDTLQLFNVLINFDIKLFFDEDHEITDTDDVKYCYIPMKLDAITNVMTIHQVVTDDKGHTTYRFLSCFCCHPRMF